MQGELPWNRVLCRDHQLQRLKSKNAQVSGRPNRAREEPAQDLSCEIPIPSADEMQTNPEIPHVPSSVIPSSSIPVQISPGASSSGGVKRVRVVRVLRCQILRLFRGVAG